MRICSIWPLATFASLAAVQAAPLGSRQDAGLAKIDITVLKLAVLAESLESTFYKQAAAKFTAQDFAAAGHVDGQAVLDNINIIAGDEATHQTVLESVLTGAGQDASDVNSCSFGFDAALADVPTFLATAQALEVVGAAAYSGASILLESKTILLAAAFILTVEARHSMNLNLLNLGTPVPNAFDIALTPQSVLSVAAPFIIGGCDPVAALGLTPNPALTVSNSGALKAGDVLTFAGAGLDGKDTNTLFCNVITGGASAAVNMPANDCEIPYVNGPVHIYITNSTTPYPVDIQAQATAELVADPAQIIVAKQQDKLALLLRFGNGPNTTAATVCDTASGTATAVVAANMTAASAHAITIASAASSAAPVATAHVQPAPASFDISSLPSAHQIGSTKIIITETVVQDVRVKLGVTTPVYGSGSFVPLGWY